MNDMSDQDKSVLLAKAMGLHLSTDAYAGNLYHPDHMALAWRVLNWATDTARWNNEEMCGWWHGSPIESNRDGTGEWPGGFYLFNYSPAEAQRLWLNKIVELIIEGGLIEVE